MHCIKCGKEAKGNDVFCTDCLLVMQSHPVKPGTAIHIPNRPSAKNSTSRKKVLSPEEQVLRLKKIIRRMFLVILSLVILLGLAVGSTVYLIRQQDFLSGLGKNYSTVTSTESS